MGKGKIVLLTFTIIMLVTVACSNEKPSSDEEKIMNVSLQNVEKISLFSNGIESEVSKNSQQFLKLIERIEENEETVDLLDGGIMRTIKFPEEQTYADFSASIQADVFIIDLQKDIQVVYGDYDSAGKKVLSIFVLPQYGEFGCVIEGENGTVGYAILSNVEQNIFEDIVQ